MQPKKFLTTTLALTLSLSLLEACSTLDVGTAVVAPCPQLQLLDLPAFLLVEPTTEDFQQELIDFFSPSPAAPTTPDPTPKGVSTGPTK